VTKLSLKAGQREDLKGKQQESHSRKALDDHCLCQRAESQCLKMTVRGGSWR